MTDKKKVIGRRIRVLLAQQDRSIKELAAAAGMSQSNMSMIANGHTMLMPEYAPKVAKFLGVTLDELYADEETAEKEVKAEPEENLEDVEMVFARTTNGDPELRQVVQQEIARFFREHPEMDPENKPTKR